jgi:hypothetical protein
VKIIPYSDIERIVSAAGPMPDIVFLDEQYAEPTLSYLQHEFSHALTANLTAQGLMGYDVESNDCDDFAVEAWALMRRCHSRTIKQEGYVRCSIAFGCWQYRPANSNGATHIINCAVIDNGLVFYEPQTQSVIQLTDEEISTCYSLMI